MKWKHNLWHLQVPQIVTQAVESTYLSFVSNCHSLQILKSVEFSVHERSWSFLVLKKDNLFNPYAF